MTKEQSNLRSIYGTFKSITNELDSKTVSPEFWKKEQENILKAVAEGKKMKESMRMTPEKFHQPFII
jgi:type II secretory pathway component PulF